MKNKDMGTRLERANKQKDSFQANIPVRIQSTLHSGMTGTPKGKANIEKKEKKEKEKEKKKKRKRNEGPTSDSESEISCRCSMTTHNKAEMQGATE